MEIVSECGSVARILQLTQKFLLGYHLARVVAAQSEQLAKKRGFIHAGQQENISRYAWFDERFENIPAPALLIVDQRGTSVISWPESRALPCRRVYGKQDILIVSRLARRDAYGISVP